MGKAVKYLGWIKRRFAFLKPLVFLIIEKPEPRLALKVHARRLETLSNAERPVEANRLLHLVTLGEFPVEAEDLAHIAKAFLVQNDLEKAVGLLYSAITTAPEVAGYAAASLTEYILRQPAREAALNDTLERFGALELGASRASRQSEAILFLNCAKAFIRSESLDLALKAVKKACELDPKMLGNFGEDFYHYCFAVKSNGALLRDPVNLLAKVNTFFPIALDKSGKRGPIFVPSFYISFGRKLLELHFVEDAVLCFELAALIDTSTGDDISNLLFRYMESDSFSGKQLELIVKHLGSIPNILNIDVRTALWVAAVDIEKKETIDTSLMASLMGSDSHARLIDIGNKALANAQHSLAIRAYNEAIKKKPQDILTRLQIGVTYYLANLHKEAEAHFAILRTLQAAERDRYGIADKAHRVLHDSWTMAIGHMACLDTYVKMMKLGWIPETRPVIAFDPRHPPAGMSLLARWGEFLDVIGVVGDPGPAIDAMIFGPNDNGLDAHSKDLRRTAMMDFFWAMPNDKGDMRYFGAIGSDVQSAWKAQGRGPVLSVSDEENARFRATMEQAFGLPRDAWYVLLHVRESGFKTQWEAHHRYTRNANVDDYDLCVDHIIKAGGWVVRGGDPSMRPIRNPRDKVIDYAVSPLRSPELDVLLCAQAKFFLGTNSGFSLVPPLFGTRCVLTNWSPIANPNWYQEDIFVPKLVVNRKTQIPLSFDEMYSSLAGWSQFERDFQDEWEVKDNTPQQLLEAVIEMMDEMDNGTKPSAQDDALQARFNAIVQKHNGYIGSRLGAKFLRDNVAMLESNGKSASSLFEDKVTNKAEESKHLRLTSASS